MEGPGQLLRPGGAGRRWFLASPAPGPLVLPLSDPAFAPLAGWLACYPALMDGCWVDGERVIPQPGGFYVGWITTAVEGPYKGDPLHPELR